MTKKGFMPKDRAMKDDYLWDRSGEPDPEITKLENALGRFARRGDAPDFSHVEIVEPLSLWQRLAMVRWTYALAASTAIALLIAAVSLIRWSGKADVASRPGWDVEEVAGAPRIGSQVIVQNAAASKLRVGQTLTTDNQSRATLTVADVGTVSVEPNSSLRLLAKSAGHNRLELERGTIDAFIWAGPGEFVVDTPSAIAIDLGCRYTLQVDDSGAGLLRTTLGWVGFRLNRREAFIPAGAVCATRPQIGPGTPYFEDAPAPFCAALSQFDFAGGTPKQRTAELDLILSDARPRDALTLWHLLSRVDYANRGRVYDRLAALAPPPADVTREGILRLDQHMLDLWWNQLGLGDVSLWRTWERAWTQHKS
jgi:ferric-dicitrate binding protein FerR (iron transport regulator)